MTTDQSRLPDRIDVLVVGGGMAGLAAAFITDRRAAASALAVGEQTPRYGKDGNNPVRVPASIGANWRKS